MQKRGNKNNNNDNKENNMLNPIHTTSDNKNPLAPVIRGKDYEPNKESVKINNFIACILDDDDDGEEVVIDIKNSLFRKNKGNNSPNINPNNNVMNQPQIIKNENNNDNSMPQEELKINSQKQEEIISQQKKLLIESQFIQVKQNPKLIKAGKK